MKVEVILKKNDSKVFANVCQFATDFISYYDCDH